MSSTVDTLRELAEQARQAAADRPGTNGMGYRANYAALTDAISKLERAAQVEAALQEIADADASHLQFRWENIRGLARRALLQPCPDCADGGSMTNYTLKRANGGGWHIMRGENVFGKTWRLGRDHWNVETAWNRPPGCPYVSINGSKSKEEAAGRLLAALDYDVKGESDE